jgi:hypothetical protein
MFTVPSLTWAHWSYLAGILTIIAAMAARRNVVVFALAFTALTAFAFSGDFYIAVESIYQASVTAGKELFGIFVIIAMMYALFRSLKESGADAAMLRPFKKIMINGHVAYFILAFFSYLLSLCFWPLPAIALIAAILLPAALNAGLPPLAAAASMAIGGLGMALSSDSVLRIAPSISAKAAHVPISEIVNVSLVLSIVVGLVALFFVYFRLRRSLSNGSDCSPTVAEQVPAEPLNSRRPCSKRRANVIALITSTGLVLVVIALLAPKFFPEANAPKINATSLIAGASVILMVIATLLSDRLDALETVPEHLKEGIVFAFRSMSQVLPIAGFFFIGIDTLCGPILGIGHGLHAPALLDDWVRFGARWIPDSTLALYAGQTFAGVVLGVDGSGFAPLALTGALAAALGKATGANVAVLAALGQLGSIWSAKSFAAWSALAAVAALARVNVLDVVRQLFLPVLCGLVFAVIWATVFFS